MSGAVGFGPLDDAQVEGIRQALRRALGERQWFTEEEVASVLRWAAQTRTDAALLALVLAGRATVDVTSERRIVVTMTL